MSKAVVKYPRKDLGFVEFDDSYQLIKEVIKDTFCLGYDNHKEHIHAFVSDIGAVDGSEINFFMTDDGETIAYPIYGPIVFFGTWQDDSVGLNDVRISLIRKRFSEFIVSTFYKRELRDFENLPLLERENQ